MTPGINKSVFYFVVFSCFATGSILVGLLAKSLLVSVLYFLYWPVHYYCLYEYQKKELESGRLDEGEDDVSGVEDDV